MQKRGIGEEIESCVIETQTIERLTNEWRVTTCWNARLEGSLFAYKEDLKG